MPSSPSTTPSITAALCSRWQILVSRYPWIRRVVRVVAWFLVLAYFSFALLLILLRYAVLPQIDSYRGDIERIIGGAINRPVAIRSIDARWIALRPALTLQGFEIRDAQGQTALGFEQIEAELAWTSLWFGELRLARLELDAPNLVLRRDQAGRLFAAGLEITPQAGDEAGFADWLLIQNRVVVRNASIAWHDEMRQAPPLELKQLNFQLDNRSGRHRFGFTAEPPRALAARFDLRGELKGKDIDQLEAWKGDMYAELDYADLAGWKAWVDYPVALPKGTGAVRLWLGFAQKRLTSATADVRLDDVRLQLRPDLPELDLLQLSGRIHGHRLEGGIEVALKQLALTTRDGVSIQPTDLHVAWQEAAANRAPQGSATANGLDLQALARLAAHLPLDDAIRTRLATHAPQGRVYDLKLDWKGQPGSADAVQNWNVAGRFEGLGLTALGPIPGISGINGRVSGNENEGDLRLDGQSAAIDLPALFAESRVDLEAFAADAAWTTGSDGLRVELKKAVFHNKDAAGEVRGKWRALPAGPGDIDLSARLTRGSGAAVWRYMPLSVGKAARDWLHSGIIGGGASEAVLTLKGDLAKFPFRDGIGGQFEVRGKFHDAGLDYATDWPKIEGIDGEFLFQGVRMLITASKGRIFGVNLRDVRAEIADLEVMEEILTVSGKAAGPTTDFLRYIESSPVGDRIDHFTDEMRAEGNGELDLKLVLPLRKLASTRVDGSYRFDGNRLTVDPDLPPLSEVRGALRFDSDSLEAKALRGNLLGMPMSVDIKTLGDGNVQANASGELNIAALRQQISSPVFDHLAGSTRWIAAIRVKKKAAEVKVSSNLIGLTSSLPEPFNKSANEALAFSFERKPAPEVASSRRQKPPAASAVAPRDLLDISLERVARLQLLRRRDVDPPQITRGMLALGETQAVMPERALLVALNLPRIDVDFWRDLYKRQQASVAASNGAQATSSNSNALPALPGIQFDLRTSHLTAAEKQLHEVRLTGSRNDANSAVRFELKSRELSGDFEWIDAGAGKLTGRIAQFAIPDTSVPPDVLQAKAAAISDQMPALDITIDQLAYKDRPLGTVRVAAENRDGYWNAEVDVKNDDGMLEATGRWRPDTTQADTRIDFKLNAKNIEKLLMRIGHGEVMRRGSANAVGNLSWNGSPFSIDYPSLNGSVGLDAASGQFRKLEPGVGRLLGILSLQSLPRRITLDFRDVFSEGFAFDNISGRFQVARGVVETSDLRINGPAAKVLMSGSANLINETQNLKVRVQPALGESLAVGAMIANPVAGAVAWMAQKLLRDPLDQAFAFEYTVTGSWADPKVDKVGQKPATKTDAKPSGETKP